MLSRSLRFMVLVVLILIVASNPGLAWKFAVFGDSQGSNNGVNQTIFTNVVSNINTENVDLVIFQGDAVHGSTSDSTLSSQMDTWLGIMNTLNSPWYWNPGNHEQQTATAQVNILRGKVNMPLNGPVGQEEMAYSFDFQNAHFVALNSDVYGQPHHLQLSWLIQDLANCSQPLIFVKAHEPAFPDDSHVGSALDVYPTERDQFWNILTAAGAKIYFCGHEHFYQRTLHGNVYQITSGGSGGNLMTGGSGAISQYHYVVITVDGNNISGQCKSSTGTLLESWSYTTTQPTVTDCGSARSMADGAYITLKNKIVTYAKNGAIYVEEDNRSAGFRAIGGVTGIVVGDRVNVTGTTQTNSSGERELNGAAMTLSSGNTLPKPLAIINRNLIDASIYHGAGCNTSSLLVYIFGNVTSIGTGTDSGYLYIDDGSGIKDGTTWNSVQNVGVRVYWPGSVQVGEYRFITGISSSFKNGSNVCKLLISTDTIILTSWTAYNDVVYSSNASYVYLIQSINHPDQRSLSQP